MMMPSTDSDFASGAISACDAADLVSRTEFTGTCWIWRGTRQPRGYGTLSRHGRGHLAHRVFYRWLCGPIPPCMELDHLCRITACVNPDHLEPVPHRTNVRRGAAGVLRPVHETCPQGHGMEGNNVVLVRRPGGRQYRSCRACQVAATRKWRERQRALAHSAACHLALFVIGLAVAYGLMHIAIWRVS